MDQGSLSLWPFSCLSLLNVEISGVWLRDNLFFSPSIISDFQNDSTHYNQGLFAWIYKECVVHKSSLINLWSKSGVSGQARKASQPHQACVNTEHTKRRRQEMSWNVSECFTGRTRTPGRAERKTAWRIRVCSQAAVLWLSFPGHWEWGLIIFVVCLLGAQMGLIATVLISESYWGVDVVKETVNMGCQHGAWSRGKAVEASKS